MAEAKPTSTPIEKTTEGEVSMEDQVSIVQCGYFTY